MTSSDRTPKILIHPGLGGSSPSHWQSLWEQAYPGYIRVQQADWDKPVCREWVAQLEKAVAEAGPNCVIVAHSLGCHTVVHWAAQTNLGIKAALLVAPPDLYAPEAPVDVVGFRPIPMITLPFPSIVVASSNDPHASLAFQREHAQAWGSRFVNVGALGHINAGSNIGDWPAGYAYLKELMGPV